jgi:hypothetical protein
VLLESKRFSLGLNKCCLGGLTGRPVRQFGKAVYEAAWRGHDKIDRFAISLRTGATRNQWWRCAVAMHATTERIHPPVHRYIAVAIGYGRSDHQTEVWCGDVFLKGYRGILHATSIEPAITIERFYLVFMQLCEPSLHHTARYTSQLEILDNWPLL